MTLARIDEGELLISEYVVLTSFEVAKFSQAAPFRRMGSEVITLIIGEAPEQKRYTIHKNLLRDCGGVFQDMCDKETTGRPLTLKNERPEVFKLLVDYCYSSKTPQVPMSGSAPLRSDRLKKIVQLYALADKYQMHKDIRNRLMDNIQDGFISLDKFPEEPMIQSVYAHTHPESRLRKLCAAAMVYQLHDPRYIQDGIIPGLINRIDALMVDFLEAVREYVPRQDPRIRHCRGEPGCRECEGNNGAYLGSLDGVHPCRFHVHAASFEAGSVVTENCHLWR